MYSSSGFSCFMYTPCKYIMGWEWGFFKSKLLKSWLDELSTILWTEIWQSSLVARVTSAKSLSSHHFKKVSWQFFPKSFEERVRSSSAIILLNSFWPGPLPPTWKIGGYSLVKNSHHGHFQHDSTIVWPVLVVNIMTIIITIIMITMMMIMRMVIIIINTIIISLPGRFTGCRLDCGCLCGCLWCLLRLTIDTFKEKLFVFVSVHWNC